MKTERKQKTGMLSLDKLNNVKGVEALSVKELKVIEGGGFIDWCKRHLRPKVFVIRDQITGEKITDAYGVSVTL